MALARRISPWANFQPAPEFQCARLALDHGGLAWLARNWLAH
jgi:hypothetical protein